MAAYRRGFTVTALGAFATVGLLAGAVQASTPPLAWAGAKRLHILCNVAGGPGIDQAALSAQLCGEVKRLAARDAPLPVDIITLGDPAVLAADAVTLLVHASVARTGNDRLLAFTIRPYRRSDEQASVLFGTAPRAVALEGKTIVGPSVAAAIELGLAEALPWRKAQRVQRAN